MLATSTVVLVCFALVLAGGLLEAALTALARAALPVRIHVNGTRGKSSVTRLIAAALREAGVPVVAKVTGTEPRLILPDGSERPVRRFGPATIREQIRLLWTARRLGARAVVAECMAVRPDLQWISERRILRSTLGVVTNVRPDHGEEMGTTLDSVARSLANTVPERAILVIGEERHCHVFRERAEKLKTRLVVAPPSGSWREANEALALAVARELGVPDSVARAGMAKAVSDPGAVWSGTLELPCGNIPCLDATAANDPESFDTLVDEWMNDLERLSSRPRTVTVVFNHRGDRPERLRAFVRHSRALRAATRGLVTGERPAVYLSHSLRAAWQHEYVRPGALGVRLAGLLSSGDAVAFAGNTRGFSLESVRFS
ncbi:MAG: poly-gamma-glutamate synthase PgsB [Vicinamibacterales bacterium]